MVADQKHSSDSIASEQEVIRRTEIIAKVLGLDEQNSKVYNVLSGEIGALAKKLDNYHSEYNSFKKTVKRLEKDVKFLETEYLNECVDRETVVDLIHEIVPSLIGKKDKDSSYSSESSEDSDSVEIIKRSHGHRVREERAVPHKQRRKARPRKVKRVVV
jgi:hypothetical protein